MIDVGTVLGVAQVGVLAGIFWRLGSLRADIESIKRRLRILEDNSELLN